MIIYAYGFCLALSLSGLLGETGRDIIVEAKGQVESVVFVDLDGNGLSDLIVLASPGEALATPFPPVQVFMQQGDRSFQRAEIPMGMLGEVFLVDVGNYTSQPGHELLLLDGESMSVVHIGEDLTAVRPAKPVNRKSLFHSSAHEAPHLLDFSIDLDGDHFDDAVIPTMEGYAVILSRGDGTFQEEVRLDRKPEWSIQFSDNTNFSLMTIFGKIQPLAAPGTAPLLVTEAGGKLIGYEYDEEKKRFTTMESLGSGFGSYAQHQAKGTIEYSGIVFTGVRKKGYPSFVRSHRKGKAGLLAELNTTHTVYELEMNRDARKLVIFPLQKIVTDGISAPPVFSDLDADGHVDLVLIYVQTGILTKLLEFLLDRVVITCQAHLYQPDEGCYSFKPDWSDDVSVPTSSFRKIGSEGLVQFNGDFSGDGKPDMVVYDSDRLLIRRGERDEGLFSTEEVSFRDRPFFQIGHPFPGPVFSRNVDHDPCPEIITYGGHIVRIVHVR